MKIPTRKAVSPIIATLLLIAITVAAGVVVYVFVGGLSANLSKSGGNQVTEQISLDAYSFTSPSNAATALVLTIRNTGSGAVTLAGANAFYYNGTLLTITSKDYKITSTPGTGVCYSATTYALDVGTTCSLTLGLSSGTGATAAIAGTSHPVKIVTSDGAIFTFNVIAGSSG